MKPKLTVLILALALCLVVAACNFAPPADGNNVNTTVSGTEQTVTTTVTTDSNDEPLIPAEIPYPLDLFYSSGAGAWYSSITLYEDGSFVGEHHDSDMGDVGDGYPNGTRSFCKFSGKFTNIKQIDNYTFSLTLESVTKVQEEGYTYIDEGVRYIVSYPVGLTEWQDSTLVRDYLLYVPETKTSTLPEEFLWWSLHDAEKLETLSEYGLMNTKTQGGFFTQMFTK